MPHRHQPPAIERQRPRHRVLRLDHLHPPHHLPALIDDHVAVTGRDPIGRPPRQPQPRPLARHQRRVELPELRPLALGEHHHPLPGHLGRRPLDQDREPHRRAADLGDHHQRPMPRALVQHRHSRAPQPAVVGRQPGHDEAALRVEPDPSVGRRRGGRGSLGAGAAAGEEGEQREREPGGRGQGARTGKRHGRPSGAGTGAACHEPAQGADYIAITGWRRRRAARRGAGRARRPRGWRPEPGTEAPRPTVPPALGWAPRQRPVAATRAGLSG